MVKNDEPSHVLFNSNLIHSGGIRYKEVYWVVPPPGWYKCNSDGAAKETPGDSSCGGVFRNFRGFL